MISFDTRTQVDMISRALPEYTVFPPLENGGQGVVFLGEHHVSHRAVAVKVLSGGPLASRAQRARFEREIETLFRLDHPNIIRTYESGSIEGRLFYVMQRVDGPPITDFVLSYDFSVRQIVELFLQVCDGLSYAHGCGVIHRDIKPGNILVQDDDGPRHGTPYVVDFGLAKVLADREGAFRTQADGPLGTPAYMSPEQIDGRGRMLDVRSDIYSLGVVMYEVLSGEHFPYRVDVEPEQVRRNILNRTPTPLGAANPPVDADLSAIVGKCLEKDRALRYRSVDELADDLRRWERGDAVEARKQHRWYRFRKAIRRHRYPIAIAVAMLLLLAAGVTITTMMWQRYERLAATYKASLEMAHCIKMGSVERDAGRVDQAVSLWQDALLIANGASGADIDRFEYETLHRLAEFYYAQNSPELAEPFTDRAITLCNRRIAAGSDHAEWLRMLGFSYRLRGQKAAAHGDWPQALAEFSEGLAVRMELVRSDPDNEGLVAELASMQAWLGRCYRKLERGDDSWNAYWAAYQLRRELAGDDPDSSTRAFDLAQSEAKLGVWHMVQGTPENNGQALRWIRLVEGHLAAMKDKGMWDDRPRDCQRLSADISANRTSVESRVAETGSP